MTKSPQKSIKLTGTALLYTPQILWRLDRLEIRNPTTAFTSEDQVCFTAYIPTPRRHKRRNYHKTFKRLRQDLQYVDQSLSMLLQQFRPIIPDRKEPAANPFNPSDCKTRLDVTNLWFHTLHRFARLNIIWVDCLSLHLEFDPYTKTLAIFSNPSSCFLWLVIKTPACIHSGSQSH